MAYCRNRRAGFGCSKYSFLHFPMPVRLRNRSNPRYSSQYLPWLHLKMMLAFGTYGRLGAIELALAIGNQLLCDVFARVFWTVVSVSDIAC